MNTHRDNTIDLHSLGEHLYHIISASSPTYFISLRYNLRDENNVFDSLRKEELYDIDKVRGTHHHINNLLRESFGDLMTFWIRILLIRKGNNCETNIPVISFSQLSKIM